jgi:hypothetical protein
MIRGIFSFLGAALKALPLIFSFMAGRNHARSRSLAANARAKTDQADIAARAHRHPSYTIFLGGCGSTAFAAGSCPAWPEAGPAVAEEVERGMMPADRFPAFWEWMGSMDKLRDQLLAC